MATVTLLPYSPHWPSLFCRLHDELLSIFEPEPVTVEHTGSTAVPGLCAKPVIDILLGAASLAAIEQHITAMQRVGFQYVSKYQVELPERRYFVRSAADSLRVHVHAVQQHSPFWNDQLDFRNALREDSALLRAYSELKQNLARKFHDNKAAYTNAKGPFIAAVLENRRKAVMQALAC